MAEKIIIDTDPGIDDAMAIFFAFQSPALDVLGLTTVYGNVPVTMSAQNALKLCEIAGKDIPVTQGVGMPWVGKESGYAHFVHGDNGFGNVPVEPPVTKLDPRSSAQFIVDMARKYPGEVTVVAIGPLGNLALALRLEPELPKLLKGVSIMGGAALVPGNVTPAAEANIWNDPYAADIVFNAGWKLAMFGLDVTLEANFDQAYLDKVEASNATLGGFVNKVSQFYIDFYSGDSEQRVCYFHDAMALAYLIDPSLFTMQSGKVKVACDELCYGQTVFSPEGTGLRAPWNEGPYVDVAVEVDAERLKQLYLDTYAV